MVFVDAFDVSLGVVFVAAALFLALRRGEGGVLSRFFVSVFGVFLLRDAVFSAGFFGEGVYVFLTAAGFSLAAYVLGLFFDGKGFSVFSPVLAFGGVAWFLFTSDLVFSLFLCFLSGFFAFLPFLRQHPASVSGALSCLVLALGVFSAENVLFGRFFYGVFSVSFLFLGSVFFRQQGSSAGFDPVSGFVDLGVFLREMETIVSEKNVLDSALSAAEADFSKGLLDERVFSEFRNVVGFQKKKLSKALSGKVSAMEGIVKNMGAFLENARRHGSECVGVLRK